MKRVLIVDPPSGWKYGFPKECPLDVWENDSAYERWLLDQGYPKDDIKLALTYSRAWSEEEV